MPELNAMTVRYAAPEVITAFRRGTPLDAGHFFPADMYAAGLMLYECTTRTAFWNNMDINQIMDAVLGGQRPDAAHAPDLAVSAWQTDPNRRPAAHIFRQQCAALFVAAGGLNSSHG
ncbi:hypothetical protein H696_06195 [Fonticula alba]|uniref:Protein kinase domain-containing protein n=1 Tax=Fonticula alba TaxID=691883 RepID=A0A058Z1I4_FONAL|nr:hypothetical protein H696_06195 [Fonticula alba]KCV67382.1 hypothetical protein H696_06195 [Fonticula alba]|eukprot:XP_009498214.1 hypothetical protein H696_06195 [Fonticula alba]